MNLLLLLACTSGPSNSKDQSTTAQTQTKTQVYNPDAFSKPKTSKYGFEDDAHWCNFLAKDYDSDVINVDSWNAYIDELGQSLVAKLRTNAFTYRFRLVSHSEINAFALCHGWVFVDVAMVRFVKNEAELASVLAHEIMHNHKGHLIRDRESFDDIGKERGSAKVVLQNLRRINKRREFEEDADDFFPPSHFSNNQRARDVICTTFWSLKLCRIVLTVFLHL